MRLHAKWTPAGWAQEIPCSLRYCSLSQGCMFINPTSSMHNHHSSLQDISRHTGSSLVNTTRFETSLPIACKYLFHLHQMIFVSDCYLKLNNVLQHENEFNVSWNGIYMTHRWDVADRNPENINLDKMLSSCLVFWIKFAVLYCF